MLTGDSALPDSSATKLEFGKTQEDTIFTGLSPMRTQSRLCTVHNALHRVQDDGSLVLSFILTAVYDSVTPYAPPPPVPWSAWPVFNRQIWSDIVFSVRASPGDQEHVIYANGANPRRPSRLICMTVLLSDFAETSNHTLLEVGEFDRGFYLDTYILDEDDFGPKKKAFLRVAVNDTPVLAYRGLLAFAYGGRIPFTYLPSDWLLARADAKLEHKGPEADLKFPSRARWLRDEFNNLPGQVRVDNVYPCSPHAVFKLADRYRMEDPRALALHKIYAGLATDNAAYELFSPLAETFEDVRVVRDPAWDEVLTRVHNGELSGAKEVMKRLFATLTQMVELELD
ncbi:hypothetical protein JCM10212_000620 [Sporobolomyces blumeae]